MSVKAKELRDEAYEGAPQLVMTPMIDIVFQLLIFFMLACRFRTTEGRIVNDLPRGHGRDIVTPTDPVFLGTVRIKLLWCEPGTGRETDHPTNGCIVLKVKDRVLPNVTNSFDEVEPDWNALYALVCEARDNHHPTRAHRTVPSIIDARRQVPFKHVISALNECVRAGLEKIEFAAPEIPY